MSHHRLHTDASTSAINGTHPASEERPSLRPGRAQTARSWPLLVLALPATVAVWSGWVGIGQMTGFGQVYPLPGIFDSLHLDTAVTLPVGVEAYAAYALRAWLSASAAVSARTRRFARWSAIGSLVLGMAGQVAYHLLAQAGARHPPWAITTAVPPRTPPVRPLVRNRLAGAGHGRASRLPPPRPSRGPARAVGHHHRRVLSPSPGPGHGCRPRPPAPRRPAQPPPAGARRTRPGGRPCSSSDTVRHDRGTGRRRT